jgi:Mitochondrial carrier protein
VQVGGVAGGFEGASASMAATVHAIILQHGWRGLFRGVYLNYIKVTPATAVGFTVYDYMKELLGLENHL